MTHNVTPIERIRMSQVVADVVNAMDTVINNNNPKALEKIQGYIPKYELNLTFNVPGYSDECTVTRYFSFVDHKMKGKKRVYVSMDQFRNDLYIFYLSKEKLQKLCKSNPSAKWIINSIGNKWICTVDSYRFKDVFQLLGHLIAIEDGFSRSNKPPSSRNIHTWSGNRSVLDQARKYREIGTRFIVSNATLQDYDFTEKVGSLW